MENGFGDANAAISSHVTRSKAYFEATSSPVSYEARPAIQRSDSATHGRIPLPNHGSNHFAPDGASSPNRTVAKPRKTPDAGEIDFYIEQAALRDQRLVDLREMTSTFLRRYAKLNPLREKVLLLRSRTKFQWEHCRDYGRFVSDSQSAFIDEASANANPDKLKSLCDQVLVDYKAQNELGGKAADMETELGNSEFAMQKKEASLAGIAENMLRLLNELTLPGQGASTTADDAGSQSHPSAPSSVDQHPLLQHYFDKAGNVSVLRERLGDLEMEFEEARANRQFQREHDLPLEVADEEFEGFYLHRRTQAAEALAEAIRVAELAKQVCLIEGLDPDGFKPTKAEECTPPPSGMDERSHSSATPSSGRANLANPVETTGPPTSLSLGNQPFPQGNIVPPPMNDRVQTWIENVEDPWDHQSVGRTRRALSISSRSPPQNYHLEIPEKVVFDRGAKEHTNAELQKERNVDRLPGLKLSSSESRLDDLRERGDTGHDLVHTLKTKAFSDSKVGGLREPHG